MLQVIKAQGGSTFFLRIWALRTMANLAFLFLDNILYACWFFNDFLVYSFHLALCYSRWGFTANLSLSHFSVFLVKKKYEKADFSHVQIPPYDTLLLAESYHIMRIVY